MATHTYPKPTSHKIAQLARPVEHHGEETALNRSNLSIAEIQQQEQKTVPSSTPCRCLTKEETKLNKAYHAFPKETYELDGELKVIPKGDQLTGFMGKLKALKRNFPKIFKYLILITLFVILPIVAPGVGIGAFLGL